MNAVKHMNIRLAVAVTSSRVHKLTIILQTLVKLDSQTLGLILVLGLSMHE